MVNVKDYRDPSMAAVLLLHDLLCKTDLVCESFDAINRGLYQFFLGNSDDFKKRTLEKFAALVKAKDNVEFQQALRQNAALKKAIVYVLDVYNQMLSDAALKVAQLNGDYHSITDADFISNVQNRKDTAGIEQNLISYKRFVQNELRQQAKKYVASPDGQAAVAEPEEATATVVRQSDVDAAALPVVDSAALTAALSWLASWLRSGTNANEIATLPGFHQHMSAIQAAHAEQFINYAGERASTNDIQSEYYELSNPNVQHFDNLSRLVAEGERASLNFLSKHQYAAMRLGPYMPLSYIYNIMRKYNLNRGQALIRYCYALGKITEDLTMHVQSVVKTGPRSAIRI